MGHEAPPQTIQSENDNAIEFPNIDGVSEQIPNYRPEADKDWNDVMSTIETELTFESTLSTEERLAFISELLDKHIAEIEKKSECTRQEYYREKILSAKRDELKFSILSTNAGLLANRIGNHALSTDVPEAANQNRVPEEKPIPIKEAA